jgi:hypothetical protein
MKAILKLIISMLLFTAANAQTPTFARYPAKVEKATAKDMNFKSHKDAKMFRTNLRKSLKEGVNFAGRFIVSSWGCGTSCMESAIIDAKTGNVFFPVELRGSSFGEGEVSQGDDSVIFKKNSRLFIINGYTGRDHEQSPRKYGVWYFEWTGKAFKLIKYVKKKEHMD